MAQTPSKNCAICKKLAALYCYDCQQQLCLQCKQNKHDREAVYQDHNVVDIPEAGYRIFKPVPVCDVHKRIFLYYCSKCDCLTCKECMTSSHDGHNTNEIKQIADDRRQDANQITNKLKAKVEKIKKTLETIDGHHSFLIQSGCDSYIEDMEKTSVEIQQIIDDKKHIELTTAFDHRENETRDLTAKRNFFQRHHNEFADQLLKFENLLQERHDNSFFMECKGLQKEYHIMNEESEQRLSSPRQMPGFNQDTFRRVIIDEIDTQFKMGLKDLEIAVASLTKEKDEQNKELKGNQKEIENLLKELQLKKKAETELLDKNKKMKKEMEERNIREVEVLTKERDTLKEKLKGKGDEIANLSKELQLKKTEETALSDKNSKLQNEIKEKNIRLKEQKTTVVTLINESDALKKQLKGKDEEIDNLSKELQLKKTEETALSDKNSKLQNEIKEKNIRLKEQKTTVVTLINESDALKEQLKGKDEEIDNLSKELQLKKTEETALSDKNSKLQNEIKEKNIRLKEQKTTVVTLINESDALKEQLKGKDEEIDNLSKELQIKKKQETTLLDKNSKLLKEQIAFKMTKESDALRETLKGKDGEIVKLSKLSLKLQLKQKKEFELIEENNNLKTERIERNLRECALLKEHETAVVRHTEKMGAIKEKLKGKEEEIYNLSKLERQDTTEKIDELLEELKEKQDKLSILSSLLQQNENENKKLKTNIEKRYLRELALFLKNVNIQNQNGRMEINSADETNDTKLEQSFPPIEENVLKNFKGNISQQRGALMIAAIEFGTTNSGWAYSFDRELKPHYPDIFIKKGWEGINGKQTVKTPTVVLFDPEDQFHSFGYQAELTYAKLIDKDEASGWKYFKGFNMARFTDETTEIGHHKRDLAPENSINQHELEDVNGATLSSLTVFSECLKFLKDDVLTSLTRTINDQVGTRDIYWIILIPAVWSKYGQQLIRLAANQAGIVNEQLSLVYEPIAVAIDCKMWQTIECIKCITSLKEQDRKNTLTTAFDTEEKFLVINCGEDIVHIAAYQSQMGNKHVEIIRPTSLQCGGKEVDNQFLDLVLEIFGVDIWHNFEKKIIFEYLEMRALFESQRSVIGSNDEDKVKIRFPAQLFHEYRLETGLEFQSVKGVMKSRDRLIFPIQVFNDIFEKQVNKIAGHVRQMLQKPELAGLGTIFMAGSFSESPLLYEQMKLIFSSFNVLRPNESGLSALKGAVIVGYTPVDIHEKYL